MLPPAHEVFVAPIDYDLPGGQRVQPDIVVVPDSSVGDKRLAGPALLVVEIVSAGSAINDRVTKRAAYAESGVPAYWIVDPGNGQVLALRLVDREYEACVDTTGVAAIEWPVVVPSSRPRSAVASRSTTGMARRPPLLAVPSSTRRPWGEGGLGDGLFPMVILPIGAVRRNRATKPLRVGC